MFNHTLLVEAGVKPRHITRLTGVSRVTASNWLRGATQPHHYMQDEATKIQDAVQKAVDDGKLPVSDSMSTEERSVKTLAVIKRYMTASEELSS